METLYLFLHRKLREDCNGSNLIRRKRAMSKIGRYVKFSCKIKKELGDNMSNTVRKLILEEMIRKDLLEKKPNVEVLIIK